MQRTIEMGFCFIEICFIPGVGGCTLHMDWFKEEIGIGIIEREEKG